MTASDAIWDRRSVFTLRHGNNMGQAQCDHSQSFTLAPYKPLLIKE